MEKTILLIGLGQFGYHMAVKMKELKSQVLGIDIDEERVNNCLPYLTSAKIADSTDEAFLRTLGVRNFDVCVVTISGNFQGVPGDHRPAEGRRGEAGGLPGVQRVPRQVPAAQRGG